MYKNNKFLIKCLIILAVVFTTACKDNDKIEILKIDEIWTDSVPDNILPEPYSTKQCSKGKNGKSYLLMPSSVSKNKDINIKLYGCWDSQKSIRSSCETFNSFKSSIKEKKISLVVKKNILDKEYCIVDMQLNFVSFKQEYNITNNFEVGDVEILVQNPDGSVLVHTLTVE